VFFILCLTTIIFVINEISEMDVQRILFSSMKTEIMMYSSKKAFGYGLGNCQEAMGYHI
jgi:hypothetical protein